jgi:hypothetical protein
MPVFIGKAGQIYIQWGCFAAIIAQPTPLIIDKEFVEIPKDLAGFGAIF